MSALAGMPLRDALAERGGWLTVIWRNWWQRLVDRLETHTHAPTTITAASMTVDKGTLAAGTVATTRVKDGTSAQITELNGADPLRVRFTFTGVTHFHALVCFLRYEGSASHEVHLEVYNATAAAWETVWEVVSETASRWYNVPLYDSTAYLTGGVLEVRFNHVSNGVNTHNLYVDFIAVQSFQAAPV